MVGNPVMNLSNKRKKNKLKLELRKTLSNTVEGNPVPKELNIHYRFLKMFFFLYKNNTAKGHTSQETLSLWKQVRILICQTFILFPKETTIII